MNAPRRLCCLLLLAPLGSPVVRAEVGEDFFEQHVRPVLAAKCTGCHGPKLQHGGLRLDTDQAVRRESDSGVAVTAGKPADSILWHAVARDGEASEMPPEGEGDRLTPEELAHVRVWIEGGAPWPATAAVSDPMAAVATHWALQPIADPELPEVADGDWPRGDLDRFVLRRLEDAGLTPAPDAEDRTWLRRVTLDLTGLPPTTEEIDGFLADGAADRRAKAVERLLASPHYGERWGRHWLDVARYADTRGYVPGGVDRRYPFAYTYRDWVVKAFNDDKPIDRFLREQVAADLLPDAATEDLAALGFLTVGRRFLNSQQDIIDDRIDVVTRGMMGLTVACARCHDHKYDPIPTADYYSLYGVFASADEPDELPLIGDPAANTQYPEYARRKAELEAQVEQRTGEHRERLHGLLMAELPEACELVGRLLTGDRGKDPRQFARQNGFGEERVLATFASRMHGRIHDVKPEEPFWGVWRLVHFGGDDLRNRLRRIATDPQTPAERALSVQWSEGLPEDFAGVAKAFGQAVRTALDEGGDDAFAALARAAADDPDGVFRFPGEATRQSLDTAGRMDLRNLQRPIDALASDHPGAPMRAMVVRDRPQPVQPYVMKRGNPGLRGDEVPRQFPVAVAGPDRQPFADGSGRRELAEAITAAANPLTARVFVNRVWLHHFGAGLVDSPSDFGTRGEKPSHPELLDWLARRFMASGWSLKALHRDMVLSRTYAQGSRPRPEAAAADPENRLLWRYPPHRLEYEALRDNVLAVSGRLDASIGGRPVTDEPAAGHDRRTLYGVIDRSFLDPTLRTFDGANPAATVGERFVTTVPQQALYLMNGPFAVESARRLVAGLNLSSLADDEARVKAVFGRVLRRPPGDDELSMAAAFVRDASPADVPVSPWQWGYAPVSQSDWANPAAVRVTGFHPLPHFIDGQHQFGETFPAAGDNYLMWSRDGGHPGPDESMTGVMRFTAPDAMRLRLGGELRRPAKDGDGVTAAVVSDRQGLLGRWASAEQPVPTPLEVTVEAGETLDFVVHFNRHHNNDRFDWPVRLVRLDDAGEQRRWSSREDFLGPLPPALDPWQRLAQALLMTNEFAFIE